MRQWSTTWRTQADLFTASVWTTRRARRRRRDLAARNALGDFTVAYFADNDYRGHEVGPHAALPVIDRVDRALGDMFEAAGGFERFVRDTCVVASRSRPLEGSPTPSAVYRLDQVLADFRQADIGRAWRSGDDIMICPNMRAAQIYLKQPDAGIVDRITRAVLADPRVDLVLRHGRLTVEGSDHYVVDSQRGRLAFWRGGGETRAFDAFGTEWSWSGDAAALQLEVDGGLVESTDTPTRSSASPARSTRPTAATCG